MADIDPTRDPSAPTGEVKLDENGNPIVEDAPTNISEEMMQSMKNIWSVFD